MKITIVGTGFVGVVSAAVYASFGHTVFGLDVDEKKVEMLKQAQVPFFEPGLSELLQEQQSKGTLFFTTNYQESISQCEIIVIAVGTPSSSQGKVDLKYVYNAIESMAPYLQENTIVVLKSTVPPGTADTVIASIKAKSSVNFHVASMPEFLKEGSAVTDTLHPDRVVIGTDDTSVFAKLSELHQPMQAPIVQTSIASAQMAKYAANAYLATRITFINEIADLCETNGADIQEVITAIGYDKRIGSHYWYPGVGYGGSCFPKDVKELVAYSQSVNYMDSLLARVNSINDTRVYRILEKLEKSMAGFQQKKIAVLGLAFKPNTDDMREAPSTKVVPYLLEKGAIIKGYDPKALETAKQVLPQHENLTYTSSIEEAIHDADLIIALIEWQEIISYPFANQVATLPIHFFDARNQFNKNALQNAGYIYKGVGR